MKKGGALENSRRGVWAVTDRGESLIEDDMQEIVSEIRLGRQKFSDRAVISLPQGDLLDVSTEDEIAEESEDDWKQHLLDTILKMPPDAFERLAQRLLRESGFKTVSVTGRPGDGGIDGSGVLQMNLITFPVAFQCKRYKGSVGAPNIRDFRGAIMGRCEKGLLITTGTFTSEAEKEATRDGALAIDLVDGDRLCEILKELSLGIKTETVERIIIQQSWFSQI